MSVIRVQIASHAYSLRESPATRQVNLYYFRGREKTTYSLAQKRNSKNRQDSE